MSTITIAAGSELVDEDTYTVRLTEYEEKIGKAFDSDEPQPQYQLKFQIVKGVESGDDFAGVTLMHWINIKKDANGGISAHPKSKLYALLAALNGQTELQAGANFDLSDLIGAGNLMRVDVRQKKSGNGELRARITDMRPMPKTSPRRARTESSEDEGF